MDPTRTSRRTAAAVMISAGLAVAGCGGDDPAQTTAADPAPAQTAPPAPAETPEPTATPAAAPQATARPKRVSRSRAIQIARRKAGGGRVTEVERDEDDGRAAWEIEIDRGRVDHKVTIAVRGGRVLEHDRDRDDDDNDD